MTDVLLMRGGFRDDSVLVRLHHTGTLSVRAVEGELTGLRGTHFAPTHSLPPACVVFHCEAGTPRPMRTIARLSAAHPDVAFVAILDRDDATDRERAVIVSELLGGGVAEVLSASWDPVEICARVGRVVRQVRGVVPAVKVAGVRATHARPFDDLPGVCERPRITVDRMLIGEAGSASLTPKEATLLAALLESEAVVAREALGRLLWTQGWSGTPKAIDMHVVSLRRKLQEVSDEAWRIDTVRGIGFILKQAADVTRRDTVGPVRRLALATESDGRDGGRERAGHGVA